MVLTRKFKMPNSRKKSNSIELKCKNVKSKLCHFFYLDFCSNFFRENRELAQRYDELMQDEKWKEANCRVCPKCNRAVEKLSGMLLDQFTTSFTPSFSRIKN